MRLFPFAAAALAFAAPANATSDQVPPFAQEAVSDDVLAAARGTASPYASLSRGILLNLTDAQSRADFRVTGSVANLQMEVWWGTIGSELIANAVRGRL